ncbi:protein kinase domain-containing protein [Myxococcus fulvus]|uniref:protein kinase domain-containing protein n=1 Tax=Myxococcus fulvus TaxID=33 RepID=UPI003B9C509F
MDSATSKPFGRYSLVSRLGKGGMAEAWSARLVGEAGVTKPVLIKKVLPEYAQDERFIQMFISEARIAASLSHGNIAQVFEFGRTEGEHYLAMELVDGPPLHRIIKRALQHGLMAVPVAQAVFIAMEVCRGLHYAHTRVDGGGLPLGIVHRDISPENVLVSYEGQIKIVDFGIAKARELRGFSTEPGVVKGKYLFFSPEQARGEEVDARTDVWAAGVVLYQMLCGRLPLQGPAYVVMHQLQEGRFPSPRALRPELPVELEEILLKALAVKREARFESAHAFAEALSGFLYEMTPRFSPMSVAWLIQTLFTMELREEGREPRVPTLFREELARAAETGTVLTTNDVPAETGLSTRRWTSYRRSIGAGVGAALLLAAGMAIVSWGRRAPEQVATRPAEAVASGAPPGGTPPLPAPPVSDSESIQVDSDSTEFTLPLGPQVPPPEPSPPKPPPVEERASSTAEERAPPAVTTKKPATPTAPQKHARVARGASEPKASSSELTFAALMKAGRLAEGSDLTEAIAIYRKALALRPDSLEAKEELGRLLVNSFESLPALREGAILLQEVVRANDRNARAWLSLGMAYFSLGHKAASEEALKRYLVLEPTGGAANVARAMLKDLKR